MRIWMVFGLTAAALVAGCARHGRSVVFATPPRGAVYRLADGGCVDFARLPPGWAAAPQPPVREAAAIVGTVDGVGVRASLRADGVDADTYARRLIGWRRLPRDDVEGFAAWAADDGELVLADGDRGTYRVIIECAPANRRLHTADACRVSDHRLGGGRVLEVVFPWDALKAASALVRGAETAAARLPRVCPGAPGRQAGALRHGWPPA